MRALQRREWVPSSSEDLVLDIADRTSQAGVEQLQEEGRVSDLVARNRRTYWNDCINLNPASA